MNYLLFMGSAALALGYHTAGAQAPDSTTHKPQWYVGAGAALQQYWDFNTPYVRLKPVNVLVGRSIGARTALQAALQFGGRNQEHSEQGTDYLTGEPYTRYTEEKTRGAAATLLVRFGRSRPQRHLQFDWLVGGTVLFGRERLNATTTKASGKESYKGPVNTSFSPHLVGGMSLRYLLGPHLALGTEFTLNRNIFIPPTSALGILLTGTGANVHLTYRLGPLRP
ncbi:hypothetical protein [Hymenobacter glacialis]|nr:hypothetical protein [Hymenobacter glacialis]